VAVAIQEQHRCLGPELLRFARNAGGELFSWIRFEMTKQESGAAGGKAAPPLCAICHRHPQTEQYRPFCSKRCADVDLHRWLGGVYAIPASPDEEEDGAPAVLDGPGG
jgi:uncharacterized protein